MKGDKLFNEIKTKIAKKYKFLWVLTNQLKGNNVECMLNPNYHWDNLITDNVCHFMEDIKFKDAHAFAIRKTGLDYKNYWRVYTALWAANNCKNLDGDFVECGVYKGFTSSAIVKYLDFNSLEKSFYLVDTYEGIPVEYMTKEELEINNPSKRNFIGTYDFVKSNFSEFKNVKIIKGRVPDVLPEIKANKICFLHLDMNNAYPEVSAAEYYYHKLPKGGMILLDDYVKTNIYKVQREEFDRFAKGKNIEILALPTGQGLIVKN